MLHLQRNLRNMKKLPSEPPFYSELYKNIVFQESICLLRGFEGGEWGGDGGALIKFPIKFGEGGLVFRHKVASV
jgi:hypothetical protein